MSLRIMNIGIALALVIFFSPTAHGQSKQKIDEQVMYDSFQWIVQHCIDKCHADADVRSRCEEAMNWFSSHISEYRKSCAQKRPQTNPTKMILEPQRNQPKKFVCKFAEGYILNKNQPIEGVPNQKKNQVHDGYGATLLEAMEDGCEKCRGNRTLQNEFWTHTWICKFAVCVDDTGNTIPEINAKNLIPAACAEGNLKEIIPARRTLLIPVP